jgi:hypothetical protein
MTRPMCTEFNVGDHVRLLETIGTSNPAPRVGVVGVIRRIFISDPNDGDDTFLCADVAWAGYGKRDSFIVGRGPGFPELIEYSDAPVATYLARITRERYEAAKRALRAALATTEAA